MQDIDLRNERVKEFVKFTLFTKLSVGR